MPPTGRNLPRHLRGRGDLFAQGSTWPSHGRSRQSWWQTVLVGPPTQQDCHHPVRPTFTWRVRHRGRTGIGCRE